MSKIQKINAGKMVKGCWKVEGDYCGKVESVTFPPHYTRAEVEREAAKRQGQGWTTVTVSFGEHYA